MLREVSTLLVTTILVRVCLLLHTLFPSCVALQLCREPYRNSPQSCTATCCQWRKTSESLLTFLQLPRRPDWQSALHMGTEFDE